MQISHNSRQKMGHHNIRLVPNVLNKVFLFIAAPADEIVCKIAYNKFAEIVSAYGQEQYRLAQPKNRMLILAWPLCMHARDDVDGLRFYGILQRNVKNSTDEVTVDGQMRKFFTGFELFVLQCVQSNMSNFTDLNALMLDFRAPSVKTKPSSIFSNPQSRNQRTTCDDNVLRKQLSVQTKLWGRVASDIAKQCASSLRHLVIVTSSWLPEDFYTNIKLDCILSKTQLLETFYMPSFAGYSKQAHEKLGLKSQCWKALVKLPIEKRLPNLRCIAVDSSKDLFEMNKMLGRSISLATRDQVYCSIFNNLTNAAACFFGRLKKMVLSIGREPQLYKCFVKVPNQFDSENSRQLVNQIEIELFEGCQEIKRNFSRHRQPHQESAFEAELDELEQSCRRIKVEDLHYKASRSFCFDQRQAELMLKTLACGLSQQLNLTLEFDWNDLMQHLPLFVTNKQAGLPWSSCYSRGKLKLELSVDNSLGEHIAIQGRESKWGGGLDLSRLVTNDRYSFPPISLMYSMTIYLKHNEHNDKALTMRKIKRDVKRFVDDIAGSQSRVHTRQLNDQTSTAVIDINNLRTDLYAACEKIMILNQIMLFRPTLAAESAEQAAEKKEAIRHIKSLVRNEKFEQDLVHEMFDDLICPSVQDENQQQKLLLPNLKRISFQHKVAACSFYLPF